MAYVVGERYGDACFCGWMLVDGKILVEEMRGEMRFSVIIPVYNAAAFLPACLDSVVGQSFSDWECLCVDDGSVDGSADILDEYAIRDARFRIMRQPHRGVGPARNVALDHAVGDYVVFVDADDVLAPNALLSLKDAEADIVTYLPLDGRWGISDTCLRLFDRCVGNLLAWNAAYRRETVGDIRFPDFPNFEDVVFATAVFCRSVQIASAPRWYDHRVRAGSAMDQYTWRRVAGNVKAGWMIHGLADDYISRQVVWKRRIAMRIVLIRKLLAHFVLHIAAYAVRAAIASLRGRGRGR